jgi:TctA family transporter
VSEQARADDPGGDRRRRAGRLLGEPAAPSAPRPRLPAADVPASLRRAAIAVAVEALLLAGVAVYLVVLTLADDASSVGRAVAEVVYFGLAAVALTAGARGLWRRSSWARGPVVVLQILLGLVGYQAAFTYQRPEFGVPVLALVLATLYLLATPEARLAYAERDQE